MCTSRGRSEQLATSSQRSANPPALSSRSWPTHRRLKTECGALSADDLNRSLIHFHVLACGVGPGVILRHAIAHQRLPDILIAIDLQRCLHSFQQGFAGVRLEFEACALQGMRIELLDGIVESPYRAHNRHGAIA